MPRGGKRDGAGRRAGSPNRRTVEREASIKKAAAIIEDVLPEAFKGDAHAFLMTVYKDERLTLKERLAAAIGALPYEKPKLASVEVTGEGAAPSFPTEVRWIIVDPKGEEREIQR